MFYVVYKGSIFHESSGVPRVRLRGHGHGRPKDVSSPKTSENEYEVRCNVNSLSH